MTLEYKHGFLITLLGGPMSRSSPDLNKQYIRELRSYDGNWNENVTLKLNFALSQVFCDYSISVTLYKIGGVHFRLLATNGFHVKSKDWKIYCGELVLSSEAQIWKFTSSFARLRRNISPKSVPHVQHDYFSSFNQSNHWFVALSLKLPSSNLYLPIVKIECKISF